MIASARGRIADDGGSVAAEFAVTLPAVLLVLALGVCGLSASARLVRLQDAAADAARLLARGESVERASSVAVAAGGELARDDADGVICATVSATAPLGPLPSAIPLEARSCALAGGW